MINNDITLQINIKLINESSFFGLMDENNNIICDFRNYRKEYKYEKLQEIAQLIGAEFYSKNRFICIKYGRYSIEFKKKWSSNRFKDYIRLNNIKID